MSTFDETKVKRQSKGTSVGGQFDYKEHLANDGVGLGVEEVVEEEVRYSFLDDFRAREEQFEIDFEGYPTRFFSTDLEPKAQKALFARIAEAEEMEDDEGVEIQLTLKERIYPPQVFQRLTQATSTPEDFKLSEEDLNRIAKQLDVERLEPITDPLKLRGLKADAAWYAYVGEQRFLISDSPRGTKNFASYRWRNGDGSFVHCDLRSLVGASRIERKTGVSLLRTAFAPDKPREVEFKRVNGRWEKSVNPNYAADLVEYELLRTWRQEETYAIVRDLQTAQREGTNFKAQKKYVSERSGKIATVWMDKKHADALHQEMAAKTTLRSSFSSVEIDNDVSPEEFASFEADWDKALAKLPPIPKDRQPALRIRKLGKHRASGIYSPAHNTVAIDVRTSESTIHEMGHYYDLAVKDNASMSNQFAGIVDKYSRSLKMPAESAGSSARSASPAYYNTPTEVFARGFELYSAEKLKVGGRLVRPERHDRFDYQPLQNPQLKQELFSFFDKVFA